MSERIHGVVIVKIRKIGQSASKSFIDLKINMEQVQRLNGSWDVKTSLRYSLLPCESRGINGVGFPSVVKQTFYFHWPKNTKKNLFIQMCKNIKNE